MSFSSALLKNPRIRKPDLRPLAPGIDAAAAWIARAQDATPDDGVAAFYDTQKKTWSASYPETTGYIIPTLYRYAHLTDSNEFFERATRMATWESEIQLEGGGVQAGTMDAHEVVPTVFNTGQVMLGWAAAYEETGNPRFADSLRRAADWLVEAQDDDGAWRRLSSPFAAHAVNTYNTRVAFGLARAGRILGEQRYTDAAIANIEWALTQTQANGWFANNDLENNTRPLTHTIAYATRGILEVGALLNIPAYVEQATITATAVADSQLRSGGLPGRLDSTWQPAARWSCLTGNAQMAIIWQRLAELQSESECLDAVHRCIAFLQSTQSIQHTDMQRRGGIAGSAPLRGHYMRYRYPNWAAKFYMDAVMLLQGVS